MKGRGFLQTMVTYMGAILIVYLLNELVDRPMMRLRDGIVSPPSKVAVPTLTNTSQVSPKKALTASTGV